MYLERTTPISYFNRITCKCFCRVMQTETLTKHIPHIEINEPQSSLIYPKKVKADSNWKQQRDGHIVDH